MTSAPPEVGWIPSEKTNVDGSQKDPSGLTREHQRQDGKRTKSDTRSEQARC